MSLFLIKNTLFFLLLILLACGNTESESSNTAQASQSQKVATGAQQLEKYLPLLEGRSVALVGNQTSVVESADGSLVHLVDTMLSRKIKLTKVFAPEHGFRGDLDAGEAVKDGVDTRTGLPVISLYGKNKKPSEKQLEGIDLVIFDIQDVGARFYTYISTLHYVMEACAQSDIPLIVLDRPNPNAHYVDGPLLEPEHSSFVGMHPVPVVYGMTIGEYAGMINGAGWLEGAVKADLQVVPLANWDRDTPYLLPVKPSPNLPNEVSVNLYPSLCFFEGTPISAGRGTQKQFQLFGAPFLPKVSYPYSFTPGPNPGARYPKFDGQECNGLDLSKHPGLKQLELRWLLEAYESSPEKKEFFLPFFTKLAGTEELQRQIEAGESVEMIRTGWQRDLEAFKKFRKPYLLY